MDKVCKYVLLEYKVHNYVLLNYGKDLALGDKLTFNEQWACFNWVKSEYDRNFLTLEQLFKLISFVYHLPVESPILISHTLRMMSELYLIQSINPKLYRETVE